MFYEDFYDVYEQGFFKAKRLRKYKNDAKIELFGNCLYIRKKNKNFLVKIWHLTFKNEGFYDVYRQVLFTLICTKNICQTLKKYKTIEK